MQALTIVVKDFSMLGENTIFNLLIGGCRKGISAFVSDVVFSIVQNYHYQSIIGNLQSLIRIVALKIKSVQKLNLINFFDAFITNMPKSTRTQ